MKSAPEAAVKAFNADQPMLFSPVPPKIGPPVDERQVQNMQRRSLPGKPAPPMTPDAFRSNRSNLQPVMISNRSNSVHNGITLPTVNSNNGFFNNNTFGENGFDIMQQPQILMGHNRRSFQNQNVIGNANGMLISGMPVTSDPNETNFLNNTNLTQMNNNIGNGYNDSTMTLGGTRGVGSPFKLFPSKELNVANNNADDSSMIILKSSERQRAALMAGQDIESVHSIQSVSSEGRGHHHRMGFTTSGDLLEELRFDNQSHYSVSKGVVSEASEQKIVTAASINHGFMRVNNGPTNQSTLEESKPAMLLNMDASSASSPPMNPNVQQNVADDFHKTLSHGSANGSIGWKNNQNIQMNNSASVGFGSEKNMFNSFAENRVSNYQKNDDFLNGSDDEMILLQQNQQVTPPINFAPSSMQFPQASLLTSMNPALMKSGSFRGDPHITQIDDLNARNALSAGIASSHHSFNRE
eukprot:GDKK01072162.1.p1 GENE.GDKK01072162.1~~GDKK01072162.1.p1  ORF type:complete len:468 (+),score=99.78 GDKK01072162.1:49-1452(+)